MVLLLVTYPLRPIIRQSLSKESLKNANITVCFLWLKLFNCSHYVQTKAYSPEPGLTLQLSPYHRSLCHLPSRFAVPSDVLCFLIASKGLEEDFVIHWLEEIIEKTRVKVILWTGPRPSPPGHALGIWLMFVLSRAEVVQGHCPEEVMGCWDHQDIIRDWT